MFQLWDAVEMNLVKNPDAEHVRVLWRMESDKRVQVWRRLGRFEEVEELELGEENNSWCRMDVELLMLLPEGEGALAGLQTIFLWHCARQVDDDFLRVLVSAGCGKSLTSLHLSVSVSFSSVSLFSSCGLVFFSALRLAFSAWRRLLLVLLPLHALSFCLLVSLFPSLLTGGWSEMQR